MKSLNKASSLWNNLSIKEVETSDYQAACCLNGRVSAPRAGAARRDAHVTIENQHVPLEWLKEIVGKAEQPLQPGHHEDVPVPAPHG
jgi:hypothetical protein